jgi:hypothetical protein
VRMGQHWTISDRRMANGKRHPSRGLLAARLSAPSPP